MTKPKYPKHVKKYMEAAKESGKENKQSFVKKAFLAPDIVLKMLIGKDKTCKKLLEKSDGIFKLVTSDFALYEAISCVTKEEFSLNSLKEFLFKVEIIPSPKIKIDMDRIDHLRELQDDK